MIQLILSVLKLPEKINKDDLNKGINYLKKLIKKYYQI